MSESNKMELNKMSKTELEVRLFELKQIRSGWSQKVYEGHPSELDDEINTLEKELDKYL